MARAVQPQDVAQSARYCIEKHQLYLERYITAHTPAPRNVEEQGENSPKIIPVSELAIMKCISPCISIYPRHRAALSVTKVHPVHQLYDYLGS